MLGRARVSVTARLAAAVARARRGEDGTDGWGQPVSAWASNGAHGLSGEGAADRWARLSGEQERQARGWNQRPRGDRGCPVGLAVRGDVRAGG